MDASYEIYTFTGGSWRLLQRITDSEGGKDRALRLAEGELGRPSVEGAIVVREMFDESRGQFTESKIFRKFKRDDLPTLGGTQKSQPGPLPGRSSPSAPGGGSGPGSAPGLAVLGTAAVSAAGGPGGPLERVGLPRPPVLVGGGGVGAPAPTPPGCRIAS